MLYEIMRHVRNFFPVNYYEGRFIVENGMMRLPNKLKYKFFLIEGSAMNDGVHVLNESTLHDEVFDGYVTELAPPKEFIDLCDEIAEWQNQHGGVAKLGPYDSESFGGYSYTRAKNANGNVISWKDSFASRLNVWRKI